MQQAGRVGLHVCRERQREHQPHVGGDRRLQRRLRQRPAQERRGALGRSPRDRTLGGGSQHGDRLGIGRGIGTQQVQRDALGVRALGGEHGRRPGMPLTQLPGPEARAQRARDERMRERELALTLDEPRGA